MLFPGGNTATTWQAASHNFDHCSGEVNELHEKRSDKIID
jgi:hypothetical protein